MWFSWSQTRLAATLVLLALGVAVGCDSSGPRRFPVSGSIQLASGDSSVLAGHVLEAVLEGDPHVRAFGEIRPTGEFSLESLEEGAPRPGALPGKYRARLVLSDDDPSARDRATAAVPKRVLNFETSELIFEVPSSSVIRLVVPRES